MSAEPVYPPPRLVADNKRQMAELLTAREVVQRLANSPRAIVARVMTNARRLLDTRAGRWASRIPAMLKSTLSGLRGRLGLTGAVSAAVLAASTPTVRRHVTAMVTAAARKAKQLCTGAAGKAELLLRRSPTGVKVVDWLKARLTSAHRLWVRVTNSLLIQLRVVAALTTGLWLALTGIARAFLVDRIAQSLPWKRARVIARWMAIAAAATRRGGDNSGPEGDRPTPTPPTPLRADRSEAMAPLVPASSPEEPDGLSEPDLAENRAARRLRQQQEARQRRSPLPN